MGRSRELLNGNWPGLSHPFYPTARVPRCRARASVRTRPPTHISRRISFIRARHANRKERSGLRVRPRLPRLTLASECIGPLRVCSLSRAGYFDAADALHTRFVPKLRRWIERGCVRSCGSRCSRASSFLERSACSARKKVAEKKLA